jgi:hypothetical protein
MIVIGSYLRKHFTDHVNDEDILTQVKDVLETTTTEGDRNFIVPRLAIFDKVDNLLTDEVMGELYDDDIKDLYKDPLIQDIIKNHNELILTPVYGALLHLNNRSGVYVRTLPWLVKEFCDVINAAHKLEYHENPEQLNLPPVDILAYEFAINFDKDDVARMCDITNSYTFSKFWISIAEQFNVFETN